MKTFLFEIPRLLRVKSKELDVIASLINRSWMVFNDEGIKQVFVFLEGGKVLVSTNGSVSYSQWSYYVVNQALVISSDNKGLMFHPAFVDDKVFALQLDGTKEVLFMIDESAAPSFMPKTLSDLKAYFVQKEMLKSLPQSKTKTVDIVETEHVDVFLEPSSVESLLDPKSAPSDIPEFEEEIIKERVSVRYVSDSAPVLSQSELEEVRDDYQREKRGSYILGSFFLTIAILLILNAIPPHCEPVLLIFALIFLVISIALFVAGSKISLEKKTQERLAKKPKR